MMVSVSVKHRWSSVIVQEERETYGVSAHRRVERVYRNTYDQQGVSDIAYLVKGSLNTHVSHHSL